MDQWGFPVTETMILLLKGTSNHKRMNNDFKLGNFNEIRNPIIKNPALIRKINFSSFAIPAAPIQASQPSA